MARSCWGYFQMKYFHPPVLMAARDVTNPEVAQQNQCRFGLRHLDVVCTLCVPNLQKSLYRWITCSNHPPINIPSQNVRCFQEKLCNSILTCLGGNCQPSQQFMSSVIGLEWSHDTFSFTHFKLVNKETPPESEGPTQEPSLNAQISWMNLGVSASQLSVSFPYPCEVQHVPQFVKSKERYK